MADLDNLKKLTFQLADVTRELAEDIVEKDDGKIWKLFTLVFDNVQSSVVIVSPDLRVLYANPYAKSEALKKANVTIHEGGKCYKEFWALKKACKFCSVKRAISKRQIITGRETSTWSGSVFEVTCVPLLHNGVSAVLILYRGRIKDEKEK